MTVETYIARTLCFIKLLWKLCGQMWFSTWNITVCFDLSQTPQVSLKLLQRFLYFLASCLVFEILEQLTIACMSHSAVSYNQIIFYNISRKLWVSLVSYELMFSPDTDLHNVIKKGNILKDIHKRYIMYQVRNYTIMWLGTSLW